MHDVNVIQYNAQEQAEDLKISQKLQDSLDQIIKRPDTLEAMQTVHQTHKNLT